ncbi:MAG: SCP2 sterol-binding domain-containing protein [Candidatus Methanomethylophilaceae archaeon]|nr:SCP2 sterol-binding domain-containing protein [Candidatus Methanomethylophilaceae archaeon]
MSMQAEIQQVIDKFHAKMETDEKIRKEIEPLVKSFNLDLGDEKYSLKLKDSKIYYFEPTLLEDADVTITTTPENLQGLIDGTLRPMRAYVLKKIQVKGKIDDLMFLKKLF